MRITDSDNCKDVINKDINKKNRLEDIYKMMFDNMLTIMPEDYKDMFILDYPGMIFPDCDENENE